MIEELFYIILAYTAVKNVVISVVAIVVVMVLSILVLVGTLWCFRSKRKHFVINQGNNVFLLK